MKKQMLLCLLFGSALTAYGCGDQGPLSPEPTTGSPSTELKASQHGISSVTAVTSVQQIEGEIGPGAKYALFVPEDWNGDLVLYAHGYIYPAAPIDLPTADGILPLRDELVAQGYAVGYSSNSENGFSVKDGTQRTQQLRGIFVSKFSKPTRTYLMGHSLGGLVALLLAEKHPEQYAGALPMCGLVGGSQIQIDYIANVRILFDFCYPGVLPGNAFDIPEGVDLERDVIFPVIQAIAADPSGAGKIASIDQTPVPWSTPEELVQSIVSALVFNFVGFEDLFDRTHDHIPFDNTNTIYTGSLPPALLDAINAGVDRFESTPDATGYLDRYYQSSGNLRIPVLTLHNNLDPAVPLFHEPEYEQIVATAGRSDLLVQRTVDRYGHCAFETSEIAQAFQDLVDWVENGMKPIP